MGTPFLGRETTFGLGIEAVWGTAVARTNWKAAVGESLARAIERRDRPHLGCEGATSANRRDSYIVSDTAGGSIDIECCYDDSTVMLVTHALAASATDAGSGPYTHTIENSTPSRWA